MSLAKHRVKHQGGKKIQMGTDMACLYACLRKDPWRNKKILANRNLLLPPFSPDSLAAEVCCLLEWWDWLKQLGLYISPYQHRHTCPTPEANSFASRDDKTVAIGPGATGTTDIGKRVIKQRLRFGRLHVVVPFCGCRDFYHLWRILFPQLRKKVTSSGYEGKSFLQASHG